MYYCLYNNVISSDTSLDKFGLQQLKNPPPSSIINIEFTASTKSKYKKYTNHQTAVDDTYGYYYVENIAMFEIFSGKKIVINYLDKIDDDLIHTLLNYPFAILFNQKKKYVIHASSVLFNGKVFCFCGKSQSGKSSLASYLIKMGGSLISEDTCIFDYRENNLLLLPSYNFLKISDEVNEYKNLTFTKPIKFLKKLTDRKGYILDKHKFFSEPTKVDYFIYLQWSEGFSDIEKLNNVKSLQMLLSNEFISYIKEDASFKFKAASILVSQANHFLFLREKELKTLDDFIKIFTKKFL